jgi:hypothetical protein
VTVRRGQAGSKQGILARRARRTSIDRIQRLARFLTAASRAPTTSLRRKAKRTVAITLGVALNREKTRIVHIGHGFEFLGFKIQRGKGRYKLSRDRINSKLNRHNLYAIPTQKSLDDSRSRSGAQPRGEYLFGWAH